MINNNRCFSDTESVMLGYIQLAVLDQDTIMLDKCIIDWDKLFTLSAEQGVLAWVWDGICKHPRKKELNRQQVIEWSLSAQEIWDKYAHFKQVLVKIIGICNQNNIRLLLFKGFAQSELYPKPESRPFGDIDFYLFDDYERGNSLFAHQNVTRTNKRTGFDYDGVHIENHRFFLNKFTKLHEKAIEYLESTLSEVTLTKDGYYVMTPTATIVYHVLHFMTHVEDYTTLASLRFVIDFGITLNHYQPQIEPNQLKSVLEELKIIDLFCLLTVMSEMVLGLTFSNYHFKPINVKDVQSVFKLILSRKQYFIPLKDRRYKDVFSFYLKRFKDYKNIIKYLPRSPMKFYMRNIKLMSAVLIRKSLNLNDGTSIPKGIRMKLCRLF